MLVFGQPETERPASLEYMANISKPSSKLKILYGEGDSEVLAAQAVTIQKAGYQVIQAEGRQQVQEALRKDTFDLVILGPP